MKKKINLVITILSLSVFIFACGKDSSKAADEKQSQEETTESKIVVVGDYVCQVITPDDLKKLEPIFFDTTTVTVEENGKIVEKEEKVVNNERATFFFDGIWVDLYRGDRTIGMEKFSEGAFSAMSSPDFPSFQVTPKYGIGINLTIVRLNILPLPESQEKNDLLIKAYDVVLKQLEDQFGITDFLDYCINKYGTGSTTNEY